MDNSDDKQHRDNEMVLMALDQISQTIDVMTSVVGRLRTHLQQQNALASKSADSSAEMEPGRILH